MGRELSFEDMVAILAKEVKSIKDVTIRDKVRLSDIDGLIVYIRSNVLREDKSHASKLASDPGIFLRFKESSRDRFFEITGIDSRNYEEELPPE